MQKIPIHLLIVCAYGKNRSRYLAGYLLAKGYAADFCGVRAGVAIPLSQKRIDAADVVVIVHRSVNEEFPPRLRLKKKRVIVLDVEDRPEVVLKEKRVLHGAAWTSFQESRVYPELKRQMNKYLPLEMTPTSV